MTIEENVRFSFLLYGRKITVTFVLPGNLQKFFCGESGSVWFCSSPLTGSTAQPSAAHSQTRQARPVCGLGRINDVKRAVLSRPLPVCV